MSETLSDQEVICGFMEPSPTDNDDLTSDAGWWTRRTMLSPETLKRVALPWEPRTLTLNECHAVEERLTDEQWDAYEELFDSVILWGRERSLLHAAAAEKIRALASVLRKEEPQ